MLPYPPDNHHRIAFHGVSLFLPLDTNLAFHSGNRFKGALIFNNLHARQLELRWQTPRGILPLHRRDPYKILDNTLQKLRKKNTIEKITDNAHKITTEKQTLYLIADAKRLYELALPNPSQNFHHTLLDDFLLTTPPLSLAETWPWHIYGILGNLPRHARLTAASFLPGSSHLSFTHKKTKTHLASHSLADRLLHHRTLPQWAAATFPFLKKIKSPHWQQTATSATLTHKPHILALENIPALNLIRSTHQIN